MATGEMPENERRQDGDDALVMKAANEANAYLLLYDIYYEKILRYCFTSLRVKQIAEDMTSIVFLQAAENVRQFKGKTRRQFVQWLCDIADRQIKNYLKKSSIGNFDNEQITVDNNHKERLRVKIPGAYQQGQQQTSQLLLYSVSTVIIILAGIILINFLTKTPSVTKDNKPKLKSVIEQPKPGRIITRPEIKKEVPQINEPNETEAVIKTEPNTEPNQNIKKQPTAANAGLVAFGTVLDWNKNPVQATVTKGPFPKESKDRMICDANGQFKFEIAEEGMEVFTAQCQGAAPALAAVTVKPDMEPITITLSPPNVISGLIFDINGLPIEGATVKVVSWQGVGSIVFSTKTNADGFFQWDSAPADEVLFDIQKSNFLSIHSYPMQKGIDYKITMMKPMRIHGSIYSTEPTRPVESFIITVGYYFEKDKITWLDANSIAFTGDKYDLSLTEPYEFKLKVQSPGFQTLESPVFNLHQYAFDYSFIIRPE